MSTRRLCRGAAATRRIAHLPAAASCGYSGEAAGLAADIVFTADRDA